jgi:hypothetical protein
LLRALLLQAQQARAADDAAQTQALLDRWARMGLLQGRQRSRAAVWLQGLLDDLAGRRAWMALGTLALAAGVGLGVWMQDSRQPGAADGADAGISRGDERPQELQAADPLAVAQQVEAALLRSHLALRRVDLPDGAVQLQARVPAQAVPARQDLAALGITVPSHGRLDLVISRQR